jgi:hypothetical protein
MREVVLSDAPPYLEKYGNMLFYSALPNKNKNRHSPFTQESFHGLWLPTGLLTPESSSETPSRFLLHVRLGLAMAKQFLCRRSQLWLQNGSSPFPNGGSPPPATTHFQFFSVQYT